MPHIRRGDLVRWAKHLAVTSVAAVVAYVALAFGSLAPSPWESGNELEDLAFFAATVVVAALTLAAYPFDLWRTGRRPVHAALAVAAVVAVAAVAVGILAAR